MRHLHRVEAGPHRLHARRHAGGQHPHRVAGAHAAFGNPPAKAAAIRVGPVDPLHRKAKRVPLWGVGYLHRVQVVHQARARVPWRARAAVQHVVALQSGQRYRLHAGKPQPGRKRPILGHDGVEHRRVEPDRVHLVDRQHHVPDAHHRHDATVATRLRQHPLARIDQDDRQIRRGRPRGHVARVLLVPRRVGHDVAAPVRREEPVCDVDRDPLLALGLQAIDEQRDAQPLALRAVLARIALEACELVVKDRLSVVQSAPDQRALAVIDAAACDEAHGRLKALRLPISGTVALGRPGPQK